MIEFIVTDEEIESLSKSTPNLKIILEALVDHKEIELVVDKLNSVKPDD